jgi:hypothetical protein
VLKIATVIFWSALSLNVIAAEPKSAATYEPPSKQESDKTDGYKPQPVAIKQNSSSATSQREQDQQHFGQRFWDFTLTDALLAAFTFVLALVGIKQWGALKDSVAVADKAANAAKGSVELAREEFLSTHRPKIRIKHVFLTNDLRAGEIPEIEVVVVNFGSTDARIAECKFGVIVVPEGGNLPPNPPFEYAAGFVPRKGKVLVPSGITVVFERREIGSKISDSTETAILNGRSKLYCFGHVQYTDTSSSERIKNTAFCRALSVDPNQIGPLNERARFVEVNDPDYNYQD